MTVVVVLTYISGIIDVIVGAWSILAGIVGDVPANANVLIAVGIATLIIGVVTLFVAGGLSNGRNGARILVSIIMVLQVISALASGTSGRGQQAGAIGQGVIALVVLMLLWTSAASRFFHSRPAV